MERDYQALQAAGNKVGLEKLKLNEHKPGFQNVDIFYAHKRIMQEARELGDELYYQDVYPKRREPKPKHRIDYKALRYEAADVRNFCDMIIKKCDEELGGE